jgi:hypothetical protein
MNKKIEQKIEENLNYSSIRDVDRSDAKKMAERRFTKLKASLSGQNAAKTRENVSRELRQSLKSNNESIVHCIDTNYESILRDLEIDFDFVSYPKNDIKVNINKKIN